MIVIVEMATIVHNDYERMSDLVFCENRDWTLRFITLFNSYNDNGEKINFHKEYIYKTKKTNFAVSINRDFRYFFELSANTSISPDIKVTVKIYPEDFYIFRERVRELLDFLKTNITTTKTGKISMKKRNSEKIVCKFGQYVELEPYVNNSISDESIDKRIGINMYINSDSIVSFMPIHQLVYFSHKIDDFNMEIQSKLMVNYLGRPENGTNAMDFINYAPENSRGYMGNNNREYQNNNEPRKSFFDKVNAKPKEE